MKQLLITIAAVMPKKNSTMRRLIFNLIVVAVALTLTGCAKYKKPTTTPVAERIDLDKHPAHIVSAFFGLDNALPRGRDGMPVTFSRRVEGALDPTAFTVVTRSGIRLHPTFATTRPAHETAKRHTVLLIGELGSEPEDPPVKVEITGHLILAGGTDAHGMSAPVTPLSDGPSLVLAYAAQHEQIDSDCPPETKQIIVVIWAGGVRPMPGVTHDAHRLGYSVATEDGEVTPIGLGNLGDGDNYEHLYLDTAAIPLRVSMKGGLLMDPRNDPNPMTSVDIAITSQP